MRHVLLCLALALSSACSSGHASGRDDANYLAQAPAVALTGRVTDAAGVIGERQETALAARLEAFERRTQHQMVVVTVNSLHGRDVADFTRDLANAWGIGRKDYNDGIVILVAPNERKVRIAVGFGLEESLLNARCKEIIDTLMLPHFREGEMEAGIGAGVDALIADLSQPV